VNEIDTNVGIATALVNTCWGEQVAFDNSNAWG
jgi:hypothetical protein